MTSPDTTKPLARNWRAGRSSDATDCFAKHADRWDPAVLQQGISGPLRKAGLETDAVLDYLQVIGVAGECSTRVFATVEVAFLLLTTDVLALVLRAMLERSVRFRPGLFYCR